MEQAGLGLGFEGWPSVARGKSGEGQGRTGLGKSAELRKADCAQ